MMFQKSLFFVLVGMLSSFAKAQSPTIYSLDNKKAIKLHEQATSLFEAKKNEEVLVYTQKTLKEAPTFIEAHMLEGYVYIDLKQYDKAITCFENAIKINAAFYPPNFVDLGALYYRTQQYEKAQELLSSFIKQYNPKGGSKEKADFYLAASTFSIQAVKNPVPFSPENLGPEVNSALRDYNPVMNVKEDVLIFTRTFPDQTGGNEDLFISHKTAQGWSPAQTVQAPLNSEVVEGAPALSADGKTLLLTVCEIYGNYGPGREGLGSCYLFVSFLRSNGCSNPRNLGREVNTNKFDSQPSISSDGKTIYFSSTRAGGFGESDIYKTEFKNGKFNFPVNLGQIINTVGKEEGVFIHPDNQTLYFTSTRHPGLGGSDIFMSRRQSDGSWGTPMNLGYPINTHEQEWGLTVDAKGEYAFFASDRKGGYGEMDIYRFLLPSQAKPNPVTYLVGKVYDKNTQAPLDAKFELINLENNQKVIESYSDGKTGEFFVCLPSGKNYALNVSYEGYLFHSENFTLTEKANFLPYEKNVALIPIEIGVPIVLKNIFFDTDKFTLKQESKSELEILLKYLLDNPTLSIEISGHTDNQGGKPHNLELSKNRAKAVLDYLVQNKIVVNRLTSSGYGDEKPIANNQTEAGRALNRRTEFKVTAK